MAQVGVREYDAKKMRSSYTGTVYHWFLYTWSDDLDGKKLEQLAIDLRTTGVERRVVKPDQLFGKRGKHGLLGINLTVDEVIVWIQDKNNQQVTIGEATGVLHTFLAEPLVSHDAEYYVSFETDRLVDRVNFSMEWGMEIEEVRESVRVAELSILQKSELIQAPTPNKVKTPRDQKSTLDYYDWNVSEYFEKNHNTMHSFLIRMYDKALKWKDGNLNIIEFGSWTWRDANYIESKWFKVRRTDISPSMVSSQHAQDKDVEQVDMLKFDWSRQCDIVIAIAVLVHMDNEEIKKAIEVANETLKKWWEFVFSRREADLSKQKNSDTRYFNSELSSSLIRRIKDSWFEIIYEDANVTDDWVKVRTWKNYIARKVSDFWLWSKLNPSVTYPDSSLWQYRVLLEELPEDQQSQVSEFIANLTSFARTHWLTYLEVNPFVFHDGQMHCLDMVAKVDSCEVWKQWEYRKDLQFVKPFGSESHVLEAEIEALDAETGASLKFSTMNTDGKIWLLLWWGGASVIVMDKLAELWLMDQVINYGELSWNPSYGDNKAYIKWLLELMLSNDHPKQYLCLMGGIANFTKIDVLCSAFIDALDPYIDQIKTKNIHCIVRRWWPADTAWLSKIETFLSTHNIPHTIADGDEYLTLPLETITFE